MSEKEITIWWNGSNLLGNQQQSVSLFFYVFFIKDFKFLEGLGPCVDCANRDVFNQGEDSMTRETKMWIEEAQELIMLQEDEAILKTS